MQTKKGFDAKRLVMQAASTGLIIMVGLGLSGCGKQMARIESNQLRLQRMAQANTQQITDKLTCMEQNQFGLQRMVQTNAEQIAGNVARIEQSQFGLQARIKDVQNSAQEGTSNIMAAFEQGQTKLRATVQDSNRQLRADIAAVDKNQRALQGQIGDLQQNVQTLAAATGTVEEGQRGLHGQIGHLQQNIQTVAAATNAAEQHLLQLQESLLNSTRDLTSIIDLIGQKQLKFEERLQNDVLATADTVIAIQRDQAKLQGQIEDVQNSAKAINNIMADLDRLKALLSARLSEISAAATTEAKPSAPQGEE
jgi:chromosome segregation ATPase